MTTSKSYPHTLKDEQGELTVRLMDAEHREAMINLSQKLSEADLWFMRRDITKPEAVDAWIRDIENNRAITLLVEDKGKIIAYGSLYHNQLYWNRHIAEIRIMVSSPYRNRGLGSKLARELMSFAKELEFEKLFSYTSVEDKGAQKMLENVGFKPEAMLADWIKTRDERTHDLLIMSVALNSLES